MSTQTHAQALLDRLYDGLPGTVPDLDRLDADGPFAPGMYVVLEESLPWHAAGLEDLSALPPGSVVVDATETATGTNGSPGTPSTRPTGAWSGSATYGEHATTHPTSQAPQTPTGSTTPPTQRKKASHERPNPPSPRRRHHRHHHRSRTHRSHSMTLHPINFDEIRPGDWIATRHPNYPGELLASGTVHHIVECKDHVRAVGADGGALARSDMPGIVTDTPKEPRND